MSMSRDFPFPFSSESRKVLGSLKALMLAMRDSFQELHAGLANQAVARRARVPFGDNLRAGARISFT